MMTGNAPPPTCHCTNPLPVKHLIKIQDGGIESLIYLAFRSKITPALQAMQLPFHATFARDVNILSLA